MNTLFYISDKQKDRHYEIRFCKVDDQVMISNSGHESLVTYEEEFFNLIDKYFKDNY